MKKYFGFFLFALLIIAFSATAYGLEFKASGYVRVDSVLYENVAKTAIDAGIYGPVDSDFLPGTKAHNRTNSYMASRARLKFDLIEDKNLKGVIYFEMDSSTWGDKAGDRGRVGFWGADRAAVEVKHTYLDVGLPYFGIPLPMTVRLGIQGVSVRKDIVIDQDGAGINIGIKADPVSINPFWFKPYEGLTATADDVDFYGVDVKANIDKITIGGYVLYTNFNSYPIPTTTAKYSDATPVFPYEADFTWLGIYSDGKIGPVKYNFDLAFVNGEVEHTRDLTIKDVDYSGWATIIKLDYPWEKFNFGGTFMYASGSDQKKTSGNGLPGTTTPWGTTTTKVKSYVMPPEPGSFETGFVFYDNWALGIEKFGADKSGKLSGNDTAGRVSRADIGGTWMARVYGACKVAPWYQIHVQAMYIGDTTKNGNTVGNARKTGTTNPRDDKDIGWEVGLLNTINIYKNLTFFAGGGILFAGDALANFNGTTLRNEKPDDPWQIATRLVYEF